MKTAIVVLSHFYGRYGFSDRQLKRMNLALKLFNEQKADYIITTGGYGFFNRSKKALGVWGEEYMTSKGIPKNVILVDDESKDTRENLSKSLELVNKYDIGKVTIVTSFDHMFRVKFLAKRIFPKNIALDFAVSDYYSTWKVTIWDFFWHIGGWIKLGVREIIKP